MNGCKCKIRVEIRTQFIYILQYNLFFYLVRCLPRSTMYICLWMHYFTQAWVSRKCCIRKPPEWSNITWQPFSAFRSIFPSGETSFPIWHWVFTIESKVCLVLHWEVFAYNNKQYTLDVIQIHLRKLYVDIQFRLISCSKAVIDNVCSRFC